MPLAATPSSQTRATQCPRGTLMRARSAVQRWGTARSFTVGSPPRVDSTSAPSKPLSALRAARPAAFGPREPGLAAPHPPTLRTTALGATDELHRESVQRDRHTSHLSDHLPQRRGPFTRTAVE